MKIGVILSGAYVSADIQTEFGKVIPVELPLANKKVLDGHLHNLDGLVDKVILTIPETCSFTSSKVEVMKTPDNSGLIDVLHSLKDYYNDSDELLIQYGDSVMNNNLFQHQNCYARVTTELSYSNWHYFDDGSIFAGALRVKVSIFKDCLKEVDRISTFIDNIENKLSPVTPEKWLDVGHYTTYYNSKRKHLETRSFNSLRIDGSMATKYSTDTQKLFYEYRWLKEFSDCLPGIVPYANNFDITNLGASYNIEYYPLPTLAELYVYGKHDSIIWDNIIDTLKNTLNKLHTQRISRKKHKFYSLKILEREKDLLEYLGKNQFEYHNEQKELADKLDLYDTILVPSHGDFCFSNILFDLRQQIPKILDPRGFMDRSMGYNPMMPSNYDYFKLAHSYVAGYDFVISDEVFELNEELLANFARNFNIPIPMLRMGLSHLFYSMIPLHDDRPERQSKFLELSKYFCYDSNNISG